MKQIKFRGFRTDGKGWVEGSLVIDIDGNCSIIDYANDKTKTYTWHDIIPESLGMFWGRTDKNGKEIFGSIPVNGVMSKGGDVVKRSLSGATPTTTDDVYFHKGCFVIGTHDYIKPLSSYCTIEIIGNQYELQNQ